MAASANTNANGESSVLKVVAGVFGLFAGIVALVYVFGGVVLLLRLQTRGLRADVVVSALPRNYVVSVGLAVLFQFVIFLLFLLGTFVQQAYTSTAFSPPGKFDRQGEEKGSSAWRKNYYVQPLGLGIRIAIVFFATAVLAWPLSRWIGWQGAGWHALLLPYALLLMCGVFLDANAFWGGPEQAKRRWAATLGIIAVTGLLIGLLGVFKYQANRPLELLVVLFAAVLTAVALWFVLRRIVDHKPRIRTNQTRRYRLATRTEGPKPAFDKRTLKSAGLLALVSFLIFVPWRAALEMASLQGLEVQVCTKDDPNKEHRTSFSGLFIGESSESIFVGENKSTTNAHPRIAEIPRDDIRRVFLGHGADDFDCAKN